MSNWEEFIITDIRKHIKKRGGKPGDWYIGISKDAKNRLFSVHNVRKKTGFWIIRIADSPASALTVKKFFLKLGLDGHTGKENEESIMVYAYRKEEDTRP